MYVLTKEQRKALKRVYDRGPLYLGPVNMRQTERVRGTHIPGFVGPITYKTFRKFVSHGSDCIMVPWCNMWLGIERDGYVHS